MAKRNTSSFLPKAYQSEKNKKFLSGTLDQLMNSSNLQRLDGFVGRKYSPSYKGTDNYIVSTGLKDNYQLEPAIVVKKDSSITSDNNVGSVVTYDDLLHKLKNNSVNTTNHNELFNQEFYNWSGFINFDTLVNYGSYYWLKDGANAVTVTGSKIQTTGSWTTKYNSVKNQYSVTEIEGKNPTIYLQRGGTYSFTADQTADFFIQTEAGSITGLEAVSSTRSTREIYGVENNGSTTNLTFTVPPIDAQSWFDTDLTLLQDVNLVSNLPWNKVQGRIADDLITVDSGIDNQRVLEGKTIIFVQDSNSLTDDNNWTTTGVDYTQAPYKDTGFSVANGKVSTVDRQGVFRINIVSNKIVLSKIANITFANKVYVTEGTTYAGRHFYKAVETNHLTVIPILTAKLDTLFYQHSTDKTAFGTIKIVDKTEQSIEAKDFLAKKTYTAPNGVVFTNGLKVTFDTTIIDKVYQNKSYYVEGVGDEIHLVDTTLTTPETNTDNKDYIVMARGATDKNAWSRGNKWFHKDVITATAKYNSEVISVDDNLRAVRPIIQYNCGLHLYNHGTTGISGISYIDTITTDAMSTVHGSAGSYVDGGELTPLENIIFLKDNDLQTRKNLWAVGRRDIDANAQSFTGDGSTTSFTLSSIPPKSNRVTLGSTITTAYTITGLTLKFDSAPANGTEIKFTTFETLTLTDYNSYDVVIGSSVYINKGTLGKGRSYHWDGDEWIASQTKTKINQYPIFELYDNEGINISNKTSYPSSDFLGCTLFQYSQGTGINDTVLGFPLKYRTFNNVGDILFDNTYVTSTFNYKKATGVVAVNTATTLVKKTHPCSGVASYLNGWEKGMSNSRQLQQVQYIVDDNTVVSTAFDLGANPDVSETALPNVFVYLNNKRTTEFEIKLSEGLYMCKMTGTIAKEDVITIQFFSKSVSKKAYYLVPKNLESNGQNEKFSNITLGQLQNHVSSLIDTNKFFTGSLQGSNNLRDLEDYKKTEGLITQHSSSMMLPMLLSQHNELNYISALRFANTEYEKFKSKFLNDLETLDTLDLSDPSDTVDKIMENVNANKSTTFPFYTADMVPYGADAEITTYTITDDRDKTYEIDSVFDNTVPSNRAILVYLDGVQLYHGLDYTFETESSNVRLIKTIAIGNILKIADYTNTLGNYVAPTPTKLGLYPKFKPEIVSDSTYSITQNVIVGHDGSRTIAYGDSRDNVLLELEKRIYNNIKTTYQENVFDIKKYTPGRWRVTNNLESEVNDILEDEFLRWTTKHRIAYTSNTFFDANDSKTWNYKNFVDVVDRTLLKQGHWKGLFKYYFDTHKPHTDAWEMFGWSEKPTWWETRYGVAPYTSGNNVLWNDVRDGHRYTSATTYTVDPLYTRTDIFSMIPVTENGDLKAPIDCLSINSGDLSPSHSWKFGDGAPPEHAWRNSSSYPFSVQHLMSLIRPAEYFSQVFNKSQIVRNALTDQLVMLLTNQRQTPADLKVDTSTTRYEGCGNYISDYLRWLNVDVKKNLTDIITTLDIKLTHKLEGYTDKKLIKVLAEQVSPTSTSNSVYIPDEDYAVHLHKTGPIKTIPYSGVIIEGNASGYTVFGYNLNNPRFTIHKPILNGNFKVHEVGEDRVTEYEDYYTEQESVPYGTSFDTKQEVAEFIYSYQKYLTNSGYDFDNRMEDFGTQKIVANWTMSVKEFMNWSGQGWTPGSVITLSPSSSRVRCLTTRGVADSLSNSQAETNVLNQSYDPVRPGSYKMLRSDGEFELYPNEQIGGIFFVNAKLVEYEHVLVFNNITKFNDVIYQPGLGNRQYRLRLVGYKTGGWDGSLTAEGFIYNDGDVPIWTENTNYVRGDIVSFRESMYTSLINHTSSSKFIYGNWSQTDSFKIGLLPNFDTLGKNFESFYDVNAVNLESETDKYGKGSIGYQNREYFNQIGLDDVSQVKFYQGMLQEKGTTNAVNKLVRSEFDQISSDISFYEEWAIRTAEYGATDLNARVEIQLDEEGFKDNPQAITIFNTTQDKSDVNSRTEYTTDQLFKAPSDITYDWVPVRKPYAAGHKSNVFYDDLYPNAGYPKLTDTDATLFYSKDAGNLTSMLSKLKIGFTLWVAEDDTGDWGIKYLDTTAIEVVSCDGGSAGETFTWTTIDNHTLVIGDIVVIKDYHTDSTVTTRNGVYQITGVPSLQSFTTSSLATDDAGKLLRKDVATGKAPVLRFKNIRFKEGERITAPKLGWQVNDKIYIDKDVSGNWLVAKKDSKYTQNQAITQLAGLADDEFGDAMCSDENNQWLVVGQKSQNRIQVYKPNPIDLEQNTVIINTVAGIGELGASVDTGAPSTRQLKDNKLYKQHQGKYDDWDSTQRWLVAGAPNTNSGKGAVLFYYLDPKSGSFLPGTLHQPPGLTSSAKFGSKVKMSANEMWCAVSAPGDKKVFVYNRKDPTPNEVRTEGFTGNGSTTTFVLPSFWGEPSTASELYIRVNGVDYMATRDYEYDSNTRTIEFTTAPANSASIGVTYLGGWCLQTTHLGTTDDYGTSIDIDAQGRTLVIGAPNTSTVGDISTSKMGAVFVSTRHYQSFVADGITKTFTVDTSTIGNMSDYGTVWVNGHNVSGVKDSTVQWTKSGATITFITAPVKSDEVTIWTEHWIEHEAIKPHADNIQEDGKFGSSSIAIDEEGQSIYVGMPLLDSNAENTGAVEIFDKNQKLINGKCFVTSYDGFASPHTATESFYINGYKITASSNTIASIVTDINNANIPGITASATGTTTLDIISTVNKLNSIQINPGVTGTLSTDIGLKTWNTSTSITLNQEVTSGHKFGEVIKVSRNNDLLVVGCPSGSVPLTTPIDSGSTIFDGRGTRFQSHTFFTGSAHVFQKLGNDWIEADSLFSTSTSANDSFGHSIEIADNTIYVGAPHEDNGAISNTGHILKFGIIGECFSISEKQQPLVDIDRINKAFLYNKDTNRIETYLDFIDPIKGKILGIAEQEIDYKTTWDPAVYNYTNDVFGVNTGESFWNQEEFVGKIWWDLSELKFINYEQGDADYKSLFWGNTFPESVVGIYEWVESTEKPSLYTEGLPKYGDNAYVEIQKINTTTKLLETKYYFWVSAKATVSDKKSLSTVGVTRYIVDPITNGGAFIQFIGKDQLALVNVATYLEATNTVLVVEYDKKPNDKILHTEWELIPEGSPSLEIPDELYNKIKDSLAGADSQGNIVPDVNLSAGDKYGINIRPRQGVFMNRFLALKEYLTYVNDVIKKYNICDSLNFNGLNKEETLPITTSGEYNEAVNTLDELSYIRADLKDIGYKVAVLTDSVVRGRWSIHTLLSDRTWERTRTQSYDTKKFWSYIDWYDVGYGIDTNIDYRYTDFNKVYENEDVIADKSIIKITTGTSWDLYIKEGNKHTLIGQNNGTLKFGNELYDYVKTNFGFDTEGYDFNLMDTEPQQETRNILDAIKNQVLVGDLKNEHNKLMFVLLKFVLQEQQYVDWLFKTSFIQVTHNLRALDQFPTYQRDNQEFVKNYINEVKPYHTKIREYVLGYNKLETYLGDASDFDLPSTYDSITKSFRSPNKEQSHDSATIDNNNAYKMWRENYTYSVDSVRLSRWGIGYQTAPTLIFSAPQVAGGVTATATCTIIDNHIDVVTMTNKGSGYTSPPVVTVDGGSPTVVAILHPVLSNANTRKIKETLKFDRIKFSSDVKTWAKNTAYTTTDIIQHNKEAYSVNENFTSGTTFDSDKLTIKADATFNNAMDRTMAFYDPGVGQDAVDLGAIFKGITYPGTKVQGPLFARDPGFDKGLFDTRTFDNYDVGPDGRLLLSSRDLDLDLQSKFDDSQLGLRPEDIIVDGSSRFVDAYSSHAPEEFVPGRVFDSLSINVFTSPSTDVDDDNALGFPIYSINYKGTGNRKVFKFGDDKTGTDQAVVVYSKATGRVSTTNYTVNWIDHEITFTTAPVEDDIISVTSFGNTGESVLLDYEVDVFSNFSSVNVPIAYTLIQNKQYFILVNGVSITNGTLSADGRDTKWTPASNLTSGDKVRVMFFDVASSATRTFSKVTVDEFTWTSGAKTFTLTDGADNFLSRTDKIIVELNGVRLRPPVFTYLTNDSSSATYDITTSADVNHATLSKSGTKVYINGVQTTAYTIVTGSGAGIKAVRLDEAPAANSKIDVEVTAGADYNLSNATTLNITGGTFTAGSKVVVTTFNNHNNLKMTTETFKGGTSNAITTDIGFDVRGFESVAFDAVTASVVNIAEFNIFRTPTNMAYLWITKNGVKLVPNQDYKLVGNKIAFANSLQANDITMVTQFTEEIIKPAIGFKIFKDLFDKTYYYRLSNKHMTFITAELLSSHTEISLSDTRQFVNPDPVKNIPGVIWINSERIEYLEIDFTTNKISRLRRGTSGTHIPASHPNGAIAVDVSSRQEIPSAHSKTWYNVSGGNASDGLGLQNSTTLQSNFLLDEPTYIKS